MWKQATAGSRQLESLDLDDMSSFQVSQEQRSTPQSCLTLDSFQTVTLKPQKRRIDAKSDRWTPVKIVKPFEFRHVFRNISQQTLQHLAAVPLALEAVICPSFSFILAAGLAASFRGEDQSVEDDSGEDMATAEG